METTTYQELANEVIEFKQAVEEADMDTTNVELACQWANYFQGIGHKLIQLADKLKLESDTDMQEILRKAGFMYEHFNEIYNQLSE